MARVLLTGFEPFGGHAENVSEQVANRLLGETKQVALSPAGEWGWDADEVELTFDGGILGCDETGAAAGVTRLGELATREQLPAAIIHLGLAEKATQIRIETRAVNRLDFRIPDNQGRQIKDAQIIENGPLVRLTTAPEKALSAWTKDIDEVRMSEDCGEFVCNETYFRTLDTIERNLYMDAAGRSLPALFVHLPPPDVLDIDTQVNHVAEIAARLVARPAIRVVGGVVVEDGRVLACRRAADEVMPGMWEFPGGKIGPGESPEAALRREMQEELGLDVEVHGTLGAHTHDYGSVLVALQFILCTAAGQAPTLSVHSEMRWLQTDDLLDVDWLAPDVAFVETLARDGLPQSSSV